MPETTLRPMTLDDVDFLVHLLRAVYGWAEDDHERQADADARTRADATSQANGEIESSITYVIHADSGPVGRLRVVRTPERVHLAGIQIHPDHQGRGIGTSVITSVLEEGRERRLPVELEVAKDNPNAERLYVRLGFRRFGEQGNDYLMTTA